MAVPNPGPMGRLGVCNPRSVKHVALRESPRHQHERRSGAAVPDGNKPGCWCEYGHCRVGGHDDIVRHGRVVTPEYEPPGYVTPGDGGIGPLDVGKGVNLPASEFAISERHVRVVRGGGDIHDPAC